MKILIGLLTILVTITSIAEQKINMSFKNEDLGVALKRYSEATGQKFIIDSTVRGNITMLNPSEVTAEEAYNQLSESLALNGFAIVKHGDIFTVRNARSAQRDAMEVTSELPSAKPQRLATWVINLKHTSANELMRDLRVLTSSYGELTSNMQNNQLIITDWTSNLQRVAELIKQVDKPTDPSIAKLVAQAKKERKERKEIKVVKAVKNKDGSTQKTETTETLEK